jgi:hypothetical protein
MSPPDIIEITLKVVRAFEKLDIDYHVGGSLASSAFGISRATMDVDMVADMKAQQAAAFVGLVKDEYYIDEEAVREAIRRRLSFNLIGVPVGDEGSDTIFAGEWSLDEPNCVYCDDAWFYTGWPGSCQAYDSYPGGSSDFASGCLRSTNPECRYDCDGYHGHCELTP